MATATIAPGTVIASMFTYKGDHGTSGRARNSKTRIYTGATEEEIKEQFGLDRPAYSRMGEDPVLDAAWRAYNRAEIAVMRAKVTTWLREAGCDVTVKFSRHAGCSCSCAPGFIADKMIRRGNRQVHQFHVTTRPVGTV